ncbi:ubiquitin-specific protease otu1 [Umbelopsis sp. WA50703]
MKAQAQPNANTDTNMNANINPLQQTLPPSSINNNDMQAVEVDGSYLVIREMEDDNSCLFRAIGYALSKDVGRAQELREIQLLRKAHISVVAAAIQSDPINYPEAILGQLNAILTG